MLLGCEGVEMRDKLSDAFINHVIPCIVNIKVGLSTSKENSFICFSDSPLTVMINVFYFILKALFVLKIFKFLSWLFDCAEKTASLER